MKISTKTLTVFVHETYVIGLYQSSLKGIAASDVQFSPSTLRISNTPMTIPTMFHRRVNRPGTPGRILLATNPR